MSRIVRIAAAQMGATHVWDTREETMKRMKALLRDAAEQGAKLVLFPEIAFTTFFPRYLILDPDELDKWFEHGDIRTSQHTKAIFDLAQELSVDICVGFAEATEDGKHFNSCAYYHAGTASILSKYRKIHLPGDFEPLPNAKINQLEKRYFLPGDLGFTAFRVPGLLPRDEQPKSADPIFGMMICNDRRWAEAWRVLGLQGVEIVLCGYNTTGYAPALWGHSEGVDPEKAEEMAVFHHKLCMQCHSYTNSTFSVSSARSGLDDGKYSLIAGSTIVSPDGCIIAESKTVDDEIIIADCDLNKCRPGKERTFDFARHRRLEHYGIIASQTGVIEPPLWTEEQTQGIKPGIAKRRILLINPNSTKYMTDNCVEMVKPTLPPDVEVIGFTSPEPSPTAVEGSLDAVLSAAAALRAVLPLATHYDAILVACYSDHPLIRALREELTAPVIGIMEASLFAARTVGNRFGVVSTSERSCVALMDAINHYGFDAFCTGVESCGLGVLGLEGEEPVHEAMGRAAKVLVAKGADTITLGCAGMTKLKAVIEEAVGPDVEVIDGAVAGVHHLIGLLRMGSQTSKKGMYRSSKAGRMARKQDYL